MLKRGLVQIYTGNGKGKTTSAIGLACRACAHGLKTCFVFFHKNPQKYKYGEYKTLKKLGVDVFAFVREHPYFNKIKNEEVRKKCLKALEEIKNIYHKYDLLILDEIIISLRDGFITEEELIEFIKTKPKKLEIVMTGRGATERIIEIADLVSEIKKIKHPYNSGIKGRRGIEY